MPMIQATRKGISPMKRFDRSPPGYAMSQPQQKWPWEKPPKFSRPDEAVDFIIGNISKEDTTDHYLEILFAGISIEEIVNGLVSVGFSQGLFSPDVAEIIKAPLSFYFMGLANKHEIPAKVFKTKDGKPPRSKQNDQSSLLDIMRVRNPDAYMALFEAGEKEVEKEIAQEAKQSGGFLAVSAPEPAELKEEFEGDDMAGGLGEEDRDEMIGFEE
jgi:hypothetical protein